jgi:hypothetical protein
MQQVHFTMHAEGVTQEQCAGDRPPLNWQAPTATTLCMQQCQNGPETNSGECLAGTNKLNISKVMPGLHKSPCTSCHTNPVLAGLPTSAVRYCNAPLTVTAVSSSKPCEHLHAPAAIGVTSEQVPMLARQYGHVEFFPRWIAEHFTKQFSSSFARPQHYEW